MLEKMTRDSELYKHGSNGLKKMQKEMWRIEAIIPQFSTFQFSETFSFIHEYNPRFLLQTSLEIILVSSEEDLLFTYKQTAKGW